VKRKALLGLVISAISLYLALRGIDWTAVLAALKEAQYWYILPNGACILLSLWLRAIRWRYMTDAVKPGIALHSLFASTMIGFMVNNVLPLRLGEIARPFSLSQKEDLSRSAAFATIVVERVFDALSLFLVSGLLLVFAPMIIEDNPALSQAAYVALIVHVVALGFLVLLKVKTGLALRIVRVLTGFLPERFQSRILDVVEKFVEGLGVFESWRSLAAIMFWSLTIWGLVGFSNYFIFLAFNLTVPWFAPYVVLVIVSLGVMLPSAPGYVGPFQFFTIQALKLFSIPASVGLSFSLVLHVGNYLPVTLLGLYYLRREHFTLKQIEKEVA
jgi:uncharacterized protein (TIRG00374 family)